MPKRVTENGYSTFKQWHEYGIFMRRLTMRSHYNLIFVRAGAQRSQQASEEGNSVAWQRLHKMYEQYIKWMPMAWQSSVSIAGDILCVCVYVLKEKAWKKNCQVVKSLFSRVIPHHRVEHGGKNDKSKLYLIKKIDKSEAPGSQRNEFEKREYQRETFISNDAKKLHCSAFTS